MSDSAITKRYAKALVELGSEQQAVEKFSEELTQVAAVLSREELFRLLLESPTCPAEKKSAMLGDLTQAMKLSEGMTKFLGLLLEKGRLNLLSQIADNYQELADERSGILRAKVTTATELKADQQKAIKAGLEKQAGKQVEITVEIDPALLGGIKAEIGGQVFDGSVNTQLKRIEDTLRKG